MTARAALKSATAELHEALDAKFAGYDLSDPAQYRAFLSALAAAYIPAETALERAGIKRIFPDWLAMQRGDDLRADLEALGAPLPEPVSVPEYATIPELIGGAYVLEGSRLGGKFLRRSLDPTHPHAFLGHQSPVAWPDFVAQIERLLEKDDDRTHAAVAAAATFDSFLRAAQEYGTDRE